MWDLPGQLPPSHSSKFWNHQTSRKKRNLPTRQCSRRRWPESDQLWNRSRRIRNWAIWKFWWVSSTSSSLSFYALFCCFYLSSPRISDLTFFWWDSFDSVGSLSVFFFGFFFLAESFKKMITVHAIAIFCSLASLCSSKIITFCFCFDSCLNTLRRWERVAEIEFLLFFFLVRVELYSTFLSLSRIQIIKWVTKSIC